LQDAPPIASVEYVEDIGGAPASSIDLFPILVAVLRRWKLITAVTLFALIATYGVLKFVPSVYKSTVEILVFDPQRQIDAAVQKPISPFVDAVGIDAMSTEINIIKSKSVALRVARELGLDRDPEFESHNRFAEWAEGLGFLRLGRADSKKGWTKQQMCCVGDCRSGQSPISYSFRLHRRTRSRHSAWHRLLPTTIWRASGKRGKRRYSG